MPHFLVVLTTLPGLVCGIALTAAAQPQSPQTDPLRAGPPLQIVSSERPPYVLDDGGTGSGPAVELIKRIAPAAGIADTTVRVLPFQRAVRALDAGDSLYPALLRTPERENRYQWIGEVFEDRAVLFTLASRPAIADMAGARQLERIGVLRGSQLQALLQSFDLHNVESNIADADNARLLRAGRIDGWFSPRAVGRATWKLLGFEARELRPGESFAVMPFWIAASANLPPDMVGRLRAAYDRLRKSGEYARIVAPLREPPS